MDIVRIARVIVTAAWLLALWGSAPALARDILELDAAQQPVHLRDWGDTWIDPAGAAQVQQVVASTSIPWQPTHEGEIYRLNARQALWIRFTIPPAPDAERWYLEIPYSSVDRVTLYSRDTAGQWQALSAGDNIPVADWPVPHRHPLLPVNVSAEEPRHYILRIQNAHSFSAPLLFVSDSHHSRAEQRTSLILGIYFGLAGLAVVLGLLSAVSLRDSAYGFYAVSVALMAISQAAMTGIGGLHLWPRSPAWNDVSSMVLPVIAVGTLVWFFSAVVSLPERSRRLYHALMGIGLLSVAVAAAIVLVEPSYRFRVMVPYIAIATLAGLYGVFWSMRRGDRYALWLLAGIGPVIVGAFFPTARIAGLLPVSFWTMHGMQIGIAIELPVLLVILMLRSQHRREHNRRIQGLDRIDPGTGLLNAATFEQRLAGMMARSERLKYRSAVLLIDLVNVDQIRKAFGAADAEELPLQVAGRLLGAAREIDAVARLSQHRFGLLVEGPLSDEDAAAEGPKVVARCLMPFRNKPLDWVARVRVAQMVVPAEGLGARQVIERLQSRLAHVPADSRRAVFAVRA